ncbi:MAG: hypothetical protein LBR08_07570, partial [Bacteroidales bacterium]|nr:hypothetical protein [Bacteroidales bacterium]
MDTAYWERNRGVTVLYDAHTSRVIWRKYVRYERLSDYREGIDYVVSKGYRVEGTVCDGLRGMFQLFSNYPVQMCQFHQAAIVRRYLTQNPKSEAGKAFKELAKSLSKTDKASFKKALEE